MTTYDVPLFRADDPPTAVAAGESVRDHLNQSQAEILGLICGYHAGATAYEVWAVLNRNGRGRQQNSVAKRCSELHAKGLIYDTGTTRVSSLSGRSLIVWSPTNAGLQAAQS